MAFVSAILLNGGIGSRMGLPTPKQFYPLCEKSLFKYSLELFQSCPMINEIIVVVDPQYQDLFPKQVKFALPGKERQDSVYSGFKEISKISEFVCIHDAARPLLTEKLLELVIKSGIEHGASALAVAAKNTLKQVDPETLLVKKTLKRELVWEIQTPQVIKSQFLLQGFQTAKKKSAHVTDDTSLVELIDQPVKIVKSSYENLKVTTQEDLIFAEAILTQRNTNLLKKEQKEPLN